MTDEILTSEPLPPMDNNHPFGDLTHPFGDLSHPFRSAAPLSGETMNDPKLAEFASKPSHESLGHVLGRIHGKGGLLEQAKKAQAGGKLGDFFAQLLATLGPMLGPIIMSLLASLLHIPLPVPAN